MTWARIPSFLGGRMKGDHVASELEAWADLACRWQQGEDPGPRALMRDWKWGAGRTSAFILKVAAWTEEAGGFLPERLRNANGTVSGQVDAGQTPKVAEPQNTNGTVSEQDRNVSRARASCEQRRENQEPPPPPQGGEPCVEPVVEQQVLVPAVVESPAPPAVVDPVPSWVPTRKDLGGADRHATWMGVVATLTVVHGEPVNPYRCKTDGAEIVKFWVAQGKRVEERPPVLEFLDDLALVARAFRACPHPMFARHVRAEGWADGTNRMDQVPTLVVRQAWGSRLREARRWRDSGFPETWGGTGPPVIEDEAARKKRRLEERLRKIEQGDDD